MYSLQVYFNLTRCELYGFILVKPPAGVLKACCLPHFQQIDITKMEHNDFETLEEANLAFLVLRDKMSRFIRPGGLYDLSEYEIENLAYNLTVGQINIQFPDAKHPEIVF